ncbi:unnamed protein product [Prorocentrum cordatum]|uniref:Retrovirus-related Pol polyprotein from transposon TNT 1-94 n=1 Tax=Prorocentrum cordatum TaxID=2364126 RepID=A0ABN9WMM4_9DINO|nr:unnamed protein product [Polarella glacialis]
MAFQEPLEEDLRDPLPRRHLSAVLLDPLMALKAAELPKLEWKGSWLQRITMDLGGMHYLIERHWEKVLEVVQDAYMSYLRHGPLDRPAIRPAQPRQWIDAGLDAVNFNSCELRLRGILMALVPDGVRQACLSTRQTATTDIVFAAYVDAGPRTGTDKDYTLNAVNTAKEVDTRLVYEELQKWKFAATRLARMGVTPPDPSRQLASLKKIVNWMLEKDQEVKHWYFAFIVSRNMTGGLISQAQVDELWRYLPAEAREFAGAGPDKEKLDPAAKAARAEAARLARASKGDPKGGKGDPKGGKGDPKGKGDKGGNGGKAKTDQSASGSPPKKVCTFFETAEGCSKGALCTFGHRKLAPSDGKCFNCGATAHKSSECTRPKAAAKAAPAPPSNAQASSPTPKTPTGTVEQVAAQTARAEVRAELLSLLQMGDALQPPSTSRAAVASDFWDSVPMSPEASPRTSRTDGPAARTVSVRAKVMTAGGKRMLLADTGATHELRGVRDLTDVHPRAHDVRLKTATGEQPAKMHEEIVYVKGEGLQELFPLAAYIEQLELEMVWNTAECKVRMRDGRELHHHRDGGSIYISEEDADVLRTARRAQQRHTFRARLVALARNLHGAAELQRHREEGHLKFLASCRECRGAAGRLRQHFRHDVSTRPGGQLSVDLSGPHLPGRWPSGRPEDVPKQAVHFVLGAFSVMSETEMEVLRKREEDARRGAAAGGALQDEGQRAESSGDLAARVAAAFGVDSLDGLCLPVNAATVRPAAEEEEAAGDAAPEGGGKAEEKQKEGQREAKKTWYYVLPLENKQASTCIKALERIIAQIRSEFEGADVVYRIHGGRASELTGTLVKEHFAKKKVVVTSTPGFEADANGRAEKGVGLTKLRARAMLLSFENVEDRQAAWPMDAAWCSRMEAQGREVRCPAFGDRVTSRVKDVPWSMLSERAVEGIFLGVDLESPNAWLVGRKNTLAVEELLFVATVMHTRAQLAEGVMWLILATTVADEAQEVLERLYQEIVKDGGAQVMSQKSVNASFGEEREGWRQALQEELDSLREKDVFWPLGARERGGIRAQDILPMSTVFAKKPPDEAGLQRKRARAVACGNFQTVVGEEELYTANVDIGSGWHVGALDVKTAFLNADLPVDHREIFVRPPAALVKFGLVPPGEVWRAQKAIYGLRASPRAWAEKRDHELLKMTVELDGRRCRLQQSSADPAVWAARDQETDETLGPLLVYVDDFIPMGPKGLVEALNAAVSEVWATKLQGVFGPSEPGVLKYLSVDIKVGREGISLSQCECTEDMLQKWGLGARTPTGGLNLERESFENFEDDADDPPETGQVRLAQRMAGGLLWLASRTRPDISFAVNRAAALSTRRPAEALMIGKQVLRYLAGTRGFGLFYAAGGAGDAGETDKIALKVYTDASMEEAGAQSGVATTMFGQVADWRRTRQAVGPFSTAEAEVEAIAVGERMLGATRATLESLGSPVSPEMLGDNTAANLASSGQGSWRTRSLTTKVHAVRSRVQKGLKITQVGTADQRADGLTKSGGPKAMSTFRSHIGLRSVV